MKLSNRTILVTGGSAGIGLAFAHKFQELGNTVIITGRNQARLDAASKELNGCATIQCDASDPAAVSALGETIRQDHPALDVLFNNAGTMIPRNLTEPADDLVELTRELEVNVAGPIRTISVLINTLKANKGTIINVSSGLAFVPIQSAPIYCATKAAVHSYTTTLRQQLAGKVHVVELMPPAVKTALTSEIPDDAGFSIITTQALIDATIPQLIAGAIEIRPGQSNQLHWMSRIAPGFINAQLAKGSAALIPTV